MSGRAWRSPELRAGGHAWEDKPLTVWSTSQRSQECLGTARNKAVAWWEDKRLHRVFICFNVHCGCADFQAQLPRGKSLEVVTPILLTTTTTTTTTTKSQQSEKSMSGMGPPRELRLRSKLPSRSLETEEDSQGRGQDLVTRSRTPWDHRGQEYLDSDSDELLGAEYGLAQRLRSYGGPWVALT